MDARSFGELSKRVARASTRRDMLLALAAGLAAALLGPFGLSYRVSANEAGEETFGICRVGGFPCGRNQQCCSDRCLADGTCNCAKKGKPCINRVGANCCTRKCRKGKCL